jgi:predicted GIY-YIG superfamily endonuclease
MTAAKPGRRHTLYRFFDPEGRLLYIGRTNDAASRMNAHRGDKSWWDESGHVALEHFATAPELAAAERRAIIAEKPLHNKVRYQGSGAKPLPPSRGLIAICEGCRGLIKGEAGAIHVDMSEVRVWETGKAEYDRKVAALYINPDGTRNRIAAIPLSLLMDRPPRARWRVHCDACNPHGDGDSWCGGCYWFSVDRCRTWPQLVDWTAHLAGKQWFEATNWPDFIRSIAHGSRDTGLLAA